MKEKTQLLVLDRRRSSRYLGLCYAPSELGVCWSLEYTGGQSLTCIPWAHHVSSPPGETRKHGRCYLMSWIYVLTAVL